MSRDALPFFAGACVLVMVLSPLPFFGGACVLVVFLLVLCASKKSHPSARCVFLVVARGCSFCGVCCVWFSSGVVSLFCVVGCVFCVLVGADVAVGDPILGFLVLSWVDESSESVEDDSFNLLRLADGYLPCGGLCISGNCCFGHFLCH